MMMLSSADRQSDVARCRALGVSAYLTKPIQQSVLLDRIVTVLGQTPDGTARVLDTSAEPAAVRSAVQLRILLAEDNAVNQRLAVRVLEKNGHTVTVASNGREAVAARQGQEPFDIFLMDVQMPEMDGLQATRAIREWEEATANRHIPIVAMTAHAMAGDRERCLEAGMDAYLSKPLQTSHLLALLGRLFPGDAAEAGRAVATDGAAEEEDAPVLDWDAALRRMDGDRELLQELINIFLAELPERITQIREAVTTRDAPALRHAAHAIKGTVSTFSANHAFAAAQALERMGDDGDLSASDSTLNDLEQALSHLQHALLSETGAETT